MEDKNKHVFNIEIQRGELSAEQFAEYVRELNSLIDDAVEKTYLKAHNFNVN